MGLKYDNVKVYFGGLDYIYYNKLAAQVASERGSVDSVYCREWEKVDKDIYIICIDSCSLGEIDRYFIYDDSKRANCKYGKYREISKEEFEDYIKEL